MTMTLFHRVSSWSAHDRKTSVKPTDATKLKSILDRANNDDKTPTKTTSSLEHVWATSNKGGESPVFQESRRMPAPNSDTSYEEAWLAGGATTTASQSSSKYGAASTSHHSVSSNSKLLGAKFDDLFDDDDQEMNHTVNDSSLFQDSTVTSRHHYQQQQPPESTTVMHMSSIASDS